MKINRCEKMEHMGHLRREEKYFPSSCIHKYIHTYNNKTNMEFFSNIFTYIIILFSFHHAYYLHVFSSRKKIRVNNSESNIWKQVSAVICNAFIDIGTRSLISVEMQSNCTCVQFLSLNFTFPCYFNVYF